MSSTYTSGNSRKRADAANVGASRITTVLHLTSELDRGAVSRSVVDLAVLTHRGGWRPLIASAGGPLVMEAERAAVRHTRMPLHKTGLFSSWRNRAQLEALTRSAKPDIIHAHGIEVLGLAYGISVARKAPLLIDLTDTVPATSRNRRLLKLAVAKGAYFRVPSDYMVSHLQQDLGLKSPLLYRIYPGIDTSWYDAGRISAERVQDLSHKWRLPETSAIVITSTPMLPGYGHKLLLQALEQLKRKDIFTVMLGKPSPDFGRELERLIQAYGLTGRVIMPKSCADWPAACWLSSVMVAANTLPRGQAQELLAAQALGRPIIATDSGANREMAKSGETAWLIAREDHNSLAKAIDEATGLTTDQRVDLAERTRNFVLDHFTQSVWSGSIFEVYTAMLAQPMAT
ncbi:MAG: glycosyltransferase [Alphaproteobacteria bacterium]|nr:glycosyltransferase [Alphaproteobacteria bacterium]